MRTIVPLIKCYSFFSCFFSDFKVPIYISFDWLSALTSCRSSCLCDPFFPCGFPSIVKVLVDNSFVFRGDLINILCVCPVWHRTRSVFLLRTISNNRHGFFNDCFQQLLHSNFLDLFCQFCSVTISVHLSSAFSESC